MARRTEISGLETHLGYWLRFVSNHVSHAFKRKVEGHGVTVAEWVVMRALFDFDSVTASQIAERLGMTRGTVSKLVDRLESKHLLGRAPAEDKRLQWLSLTPVGRRLVPVLAGVADRNDEEFFGHLGARQRLDLRATLKGIVDRCQLKGPPVD